ncbi:crotonase/enoyl-CoA hydratase family protein [Tianweitania sediminis]|uniref:Crotonase/enoyl-CoA hydratase family protein n=1 Tax=Tianweitania sediminis TaxID=1502156 RepID=A0A8J7R1N6_9HYPH|nr:crotonase/enoyl-CoA hydratase family protein [Tianweitania sediminis]MBP0438541.1 crotonase/enoyl-CoA hydratase family protein [Tianweitania sediminis]
MAALEPSVYEAIRWDVADRILTITLNRPDKLNAFTVRMADELVDAFERASDDAAIRAIVVTGAGKAFCAGMDLSEVNPTGNVFGLDEAMKPTLEDLEQRSDHPAILSGVRDTGGRVVLAIFNCKKPVIAAVNGVSVGVGATMQLAMDIRLASQKARFGFVFGKIGIVPDACSSWFLPKVVGIAKALEWTYTAEIFGADEALRSGLVKEVLAPEDLLARAYELAGILANERSPMSTALIRQMMYRNSGEPSPWQAHKIESLAMFYASQRDGKEGVRSFNEKRAPHFTDDTSQMPDFYPWWDEPNG